MDRAKMREVIFRRLAESSDAPVYWTVADVNRAIDEAYEAISDASEWFETSTQLSLEPVLYYDLRQVLADFDFLRVTSAFNPVLDYWLKPTTFWELDSHHKRWEVQIGQPSQFFLRGLFNLGLYPHPAAAGGTIDLYFTALPTPLTEDSHEPGFPEEFHQGVVDHALYDLYAQDAETEKALKQYAAYLTMERRLRQYAQTRIKRAAVGGMRA